MAKTQKYYRFQGRNPRYTTKLSSFANGMYLSEQQIPEGYAKILVNLDIDDTGNHIRPRYGKTFIGSNSNSITPYYGPAHFSDYLYCYNTDETTKATLLADTYMSFGAGVLPEECVPATDPEQPEYKRPVIVSSALVKHYQNGTLLNEGTIGCGWAFKKYDANDDNVTYLTQGLDNFFEINWYPQFGYITAREFRDAKAFNCDVIGGVENIFQNEQSVWKSTGLLRPIYTIMNNELYAFVGGPLTYEKHIDDPSLNRMTGFVKPKLTKLKLIRELVPGYTDRYWLVFDPVTIEPRVVTPTQAYSMGFNYLLDNPYHFEDKATGNLTILGAIPYALGSDYSIPKLKLNLGEPVQYRIYYTYPTGSHNIKVKVELLDNALGASAELEVLQDFTDSPIYSTGSVITYTHTPTTESAILRFTLRMDDNTATDVTVIAPVDTTINSDIRDTDYVVPDLTTAKGMFSWQNCLGLYGIEGLEDTLIFSDTEQPDYFPMPYNKITFDNKVLAVHNYLDKLIVVTVDGVWLVTAGSSIQASTKKRVLTNVFIPELDAYNLITYKDQIFFKTDTQFYSLKPNAYTSDATDLKNYINSVAISNLTKDFKGQLLAIINEVYKNTREGMVTTYDPVESTPTTESNRFNYFTELNVGDVFVALRNEDIHYMYNCTPVMLTKEGYQTSYGDSALVHLIYNTTTRTWRLYIESSAGITSDAYTSEYYPVWYKDKQTGEYYEMHPVRRNDALSTATPYANLIFIKQDPDSVNDIIDVELAPGIPGISLGSVYANYTYLDTGVLSIEDALTKRWREVQFSIYNGEQAKLQFKTDFLLDGVKRIDHTNYSTYHITDPNDSNYGVVFVTLNEYGTENLFVPGVSAVRTVDGTAVSDWELDLTKFPDLSTVTIRFELHGRGRRPRLKLLNTTFGRYELADMNWIYRVMNARQKGEK